MTSLHRPSRWPHLFLEAGPSIAGVEVGDMLPIEVGKVVYLWSSRWSPFLAMSPPAVSRPALQVHVTDTPLHNGPAFRVLEHPARVERTETALIHESWQIDEPSITSVRGPRGVPAHVSKWGLRFVLDGPPLATVRKFGEHVVCRPQLRGTAEDGTVARSEWIVARNGAREVLLVDQTFDGALTWRTEPRRPGVAIAHIARAVPHAVHASHEPHEHKGVDREIAAGIVAQLGETQDQGIVGFDGIVRVAVSDRAARAGRILAYAALTRGTTQLDDRAIEAMRAELATIAPASVEQIAAMMRSFFPEAAARDAAIVEECAVLAG